MPLIRIVLYVLKFFDIEIDKSNSPCSNCAGILIGLNREWDVMGIDFSDKVTLK